MADNLLDKASILLTPTAYNDGSMLSVKPENGDGDFTFSRGSAATRVNAQGLVENVQIISSELVSNGNFSQEGSELVTNGDFANGVNNWNVGSEVASFTVTSGVATIQGLASNFNNRISQNINVIVGKTYKITASLKSNDSNFYRIRLLNGTYIDIGAGNSSDFETLTYYHTATNSILAVYLSSYYANGSSDFSIDNVSVKEVGQDWTFGSGWSVDQANSKATCDGTQTSTSTLQTTQGISNIQNDLVKLSFEIKDYSAGAVSVTLQGTGGIEFLNLAANGVYEINVTSNDSLPRLLFNANSSFVGSITNISVKEITDDTDLPRINYEGFSYQDSLGSEEVTNGDFATDSNWFKTGQVTIGGGVAYFNSDGTFTQIAQSISGVSGKNVKVVIEITEYTQGTLKVLFSGGTQQNLPNSVGVHTLYFNNADSDTINIARLGGVTNLKIDNVSVKEYLGQEVVPDSGCGSWLLEGQSTNLITYSEDFSQWNQVQNISLTSNATTSPSGDVDATKVLSSDFNSKVSFVGLSFVAGTSYTISIFCKNIDATSLKFFIYMGGAGGDVTYDFTNEVNNSDWTRVSYTFVATGTNSSNQVQFARNLPSGESAFFWGAQLEQQSYATSYIPTEGATNTRLQDIPTNSGNSTLINSTEGVLYAEIAALADDGTNKYITINNGGTTDYIFLRYRSDDDFQIKLRSGNTDKVNQTFTLSNNLDFNKIAFSYKENEFKIFVNGSQVGNTITTGATSAANTLNRVDFSRYDGASKFIGKTKALVVYKEALTDAQLQSLTTI